ncbi:MAG: hypothetical protein FWC65_02470 [Treponema sp.]|nr:hypothetical protein [Treponema sp.]
MKKNNKTAGRILAGALTATTVLGLPIVLNSCDTGNSPTTIPDPQPIAKTHNISLRDGALKFAVNYMALPGAEVPDYVKHLETRLTAIANSSGSSDNDAVDHLIAASNGNPFTVEVNQTGITGLSWDGTKFVACADWLGTVIGENTPTLAQMRALFNSVDTLRAGHA